jgi:hypothetical protein
MSTLNLKPLRWTQSDFLFVMAGGVAVGDDGAESESDACEDDDADVEADESDADVLSVADEAVVEPVADDVPALAAAEPDDEQALSDRASRPAALSVRPDVIDRLNTGPPVG